jgi:hypothetical protein
MTGKRSVVVPILLAMAVAQTHAQEGEIDPRQALRQLLANALQVTISARVVPPDAMADAPIWNEESTKLTLPGRSIKVRLEGDNVRIYLICTPYFQDNGELLLLAQGQVWLSQPTDNEVTYSSTFYSIPVSFGEKVLFFPLGLSDALEQNKDFFNIELEVKIVPYQQE